MAGKRSIFLIDSLDFPTRHANNGHFQQMLVRGPLGTHAVIHLFLVHTSVCVCGCVYVRSQCSRHSDYFYLAEMPRSTEAQTFQIRSAVHLFFCPLLPLRAAKYRSLLGKKKNNNTVKLNFKVFHVPNPAAFSGSAP